MTTGLLIKRTLDVVLSALLLLVLSPLMLLAALLIRLSMGAPILFRQRRPGLHGSPFVIYKFRTMRYVYDAHGELLPDAMRLTPIGRWLRRTSIDELPQLLNVLRGQLSLVGPRPLLLQYLDRYTPEQARRHHVKPGITGYAQVMGRNALSWGEKFRLDVWYVDHWSLALDLKILLLTLAALITGKGVSAAGQATTTEFIATPEVEHALTSK